MLIFFIQSCSRVEYVYVERPKVPITCHETVKTPLDLAKCLEVYKEHYKSR
jgi:hypothetical protein